MEGKRRRLADGDHAIDVEEVLDVVCGRHFTKLDTEI